MTTDTPPAWAEALLRLMLAPHDRETVSGDLLEQYREDVFPARGRRRADLWYVRQVVGFALGENRLWAALLGAAFVTRTALDWVVPTVDFETRATISTVLGVGILLCAGFSATWRSGRLLSAALAGVCATLVAAIIGLVGAAWLLAMFHDPRTMIAIQQSGGLEEVVTLPLTMVVPGACLGAVGGLLGAAIRNLRARIA